MDKLVTLGSALLDQLVVKGRVWPSILTVGTLGTLGMPSMFGISCVHGDCCRRTRSWPCSRPDIRFLSLYSRTDEVVRWEACLDPSAIQIEVETSHLGMGMARGVWTAPVTELAG